MYEPGRQLIVVTLFALALARCGLPESELELPDGSQPSGEVSSGNSQAPPTVLEVSREALVIGEPLLILGEGFLADDGGFTRLTFDGTFFGDDGSRTPSTFTITPTYDSTLDDGRLVLRWSRFGPFGNPFVEGGGPGVFEGRITWTNFLADGRMIGGPLSDPVRIRVLPSIEIESLQPIMADCAKPAIRGFGGLPYELVVRAHGFTPVRFRFELASVNGDVGFTVYDKPATGPTATIGWDEPFVLNPVEEGDQFYVTSIRVVAFDQQGRTVETALPYTVHRPVEVRYNGNYEVGQYFAPVPVSGCMPGQIGNRVTYSETESETRQRSVSVTVSSAWSRQNGVTNSRQWTDGYSEGTTSSVTNATAATASETQSTGETYGVVHNESAANSMGYTSTDGETWSYDVMDGVTSSEAIARTDELSTNTEVSGSMTTGGQVGVPGVAGGEVKTTAGVRAGLGTRQSWGTTSTTGTSRNEGFSTGGTESETTTFGSVTTEGSSSSLGGSYVLSSAAGQTRSQSDTEARTNTRTYSLGQGRSESEVVTEGMTEAEQSTWSESATHSTLTSYSGVIPTGRFGVFYRQTTRFVRRAEVFTYDLCGVIEKQGEMTFNEWAWAPELAIASECGASLPQSSLPEAACFIPPCWN